MQQKIAAIRHDLLTALGEIEEFVQGRSVDELRSDRSLQLILEREFEIVGEALFRLRNLSPEIFESIPNSHQVVGMRNVIAHGYDQIDHEILWDAATKDIGVLRRAIENLQ